MRVSVFAATIMVCAATACAAMDLSPDWQEACRATLTGSVRGSTGMFPDAEAAAQSLNEEGQDALEALETSEAYGAFGVVTDAGLEKVIEVHRHEDGRWSVGSVQECAAR